MRTGAGAMRRALASLFGAVLACTACNEQAEPKPTPKPKLARPEASAERAAGSRAVPAAPARPRPKNVLLLTVDSLRADMPWTGYAREIAPNLTELAKQSVVYTRAYAVSSYTAKSVAALLTGRYPSSLYRSGWFFTGYSKANTFFPELLQAAGIQTLSWHAHLYFGRDKGLEQGFDTWKIVPGISFDAETDNHVTSDKMTALGIELLGNVKTPFFAWAHYMDPHDIYVKHPETPDFGKKSRDRYDSEVHFTDFWIGKLLAWARTQPWWQETALIVSSDHGEAFGEHGMYKHAFELWEVLCRVPLFVHIAGVPPKVIDARRSQIDLAPTILDLFGRPGPELPGKSLLPEIYGDAAPEVREPIVLDLPEDSHNPPRRAVIEGDLKLILHGDSSRKLLFDLASDPDEAHDIAKSAPERLATVSSVFERTFARISSVRPYGGNKLKTGALASGPMGPQIKAP